MREWWINKAWPWVKLNWWVVLTLPLALFVAIAIGVYDLLTKGRLRTIDPVSEADIRAKEELARRAKENQEALVRLAEERAEISLKFKELQDEFDTRLQSEVDSLRSDPERLRELMLEVGE